MNTTDTTDKVYDYYKTFFKELALLGLRHIVISPGARSAPLSISAETNKSFKTWIQHDERTAGFFALGLAKQTRNFTALICTSGTAGANYTPAVIEAYQSAIPLLVLTADRPPTFVGKGFEQTIYQVGLYGKHLRESYEVPLIKNGIRNNKNKLKAKKAAQKIVKNLRQLHGPVHINCRFEEPLEPKNPDDLFVDINELEKITKSKSTKIPKTKKLIKAIQKNSKGLILVGPGDYDNQTIDSLIEISTKAKWPLLVDGASAFRTKTAIKTGSSLFQAKFYEKYLPDVVLRIGSVPSNKILRTEIAKNPPKKFFWCDPKCQNFSADFPISNRLVHHDLGEFLTYISKSVNIKQKELRKKWLQLWQDGDKKATEIIQEELLNRDQLSEPAISYHLSKSLNSKNFQLLLANSFAIRDFDTFGIDNFINDSENQSEKSSVRIFCNRGANGIDGLIATALGISAGSISAKNLSTSGISETDTFLLAGDTAILHDLSSIFSAKRLGLSLTIIIINNNGGAIFKNIGLPQALEKNTDLFTKLFTAPIGLKDFQFLGSLPGVVYHQIKTAPELEEFIQTTNPLGVRVGEIITDMDESIEIRHNIQKRIQTELGL